MKFHWKIILPLIGCILILVFMLIVPVIIYDKSWWWFFGTLIFLAVVGATIGIIFFILSLKKKAVSTIKLDVKQAKEKARMEIRDEFDNPDNFKIEKSRLERWGQRGTERTPILILEGIGTEKKQKRVVIMNLNNPKKESTKLINPTIEEMDRAIKLMAENPPEDVEEKTMGLDEFGRPITKITKRPSFYEKEKEKEEKRVESEAGI